MVRAFAPAFLGVILREGPAPLGPIMEARPVLSARLHGEEGDATPRPDAVRRVALEPLTLHGALPPTVRVILLLLAARGQEGLGAPLGQA